MVFKATKNLLLIALVTGGLCGMVVPAYAYDKDYVGKMEIYRADFEDTLVHLAREHNLGFVEMRAANPTLDPWIPGEGARVVLPKQSLLPDAPRSGIVINLPEMKLYLYPKPNAEPIVYPISPGREGLYTPVGTTSVISKRENPTWTPTPRMIKEDPTLKPFYPPGPDNPLGTHALYLGWDQYRIHGTNKPYAIGRLASSGCIRMYPESIKDIYPRVPVGTKVTVVDQPVKVGWINDKMYVEVSPTQEQSSHVENEGVFKSYEITADDIKRITTKAGSHAELIDWEAVRTAVREHRGYPVAVLDTKGKKGQHVKDDMKEKLKAVDAEDKVLNAKKKEELKAQQEAAKKDNIYKDAKVEDSKDVENKAPIKVSGEVKANKNFNQ